MTKQEIEKWEAAPAKAVCVVSNSCSMSILGFDGAYNDYVVVRGFCGDIHRYKLHCSKKGVYFTYCNGLRYHIKDFLTV